MNALFHMLLASTALSAVPAVPLAAAELLTPTVVDTDNNDTVTTAPFTPSAGDRIVVIMLARDGSAGTFGTPVVSGFTLSTAFTSRAADDETDTQYFRAEVWEGVVGTSASGTISVTASQAQTQQVLIVLRVPGATTYQAAGANSITTGTSLSIAYVGSPDLSASCGIVAVIQRSTGGSGRTVPGYTMLDEGVQSSNLAYFVGTALNSPPDPAAMTNWVNNQAKVGVVISFTGS